MSDVLLSDLSRYIFGTTRMGDEAVPLAVRKAAAFRAMEERCWFHTSHFYGSALSVLREAFDERPDLAPPVICKVGWSSPEEIRSQILLQTDALGRSHMEIGQLCLGGELAESFKTGGPMLDGLSDLKAEGIVGRFLVEVFPWTSEVALEAIRGGHDQGLVDGVIFYLNPLQRFASNDLWDLLMERQTPIVAMRTVSGGNVEQLAESEGYLGDRARQILPLFKESGSASWVEFSASFSLGLPQVRATVGASSQADRVDQFLSAARSPLHLSEETVAQILKLQREWSDEVDMKAEPWTM
jgi:hypothetical protein